jgi:hypothetical protein
MTPPRWTGVRLPGIDQGGRQSQCVRGIQEVRADVRLVGIADDRQRLSRHCPTACGARVTAA